MRTALPIAVCLLVPALAAADGIYRSTDDQGNPLFTDQPPSDDAEPVKLDPLTTVPADEAPAVLDGTREPEAGDAQPVIYRDLEVVYPPAEQTVRHNGGMVPFRVALQPQGTGLKEGHEVEIVLDDEVRGSGASQQISVSPVHRGTHTVRARIVDSSGTPLIASPPVAFHLLRASVAN